MTNMYVKIVLTLLVVLTAALVVKVSRPTIVVEAPLPAPPSRAEAALYRNVAALSLWNITLEAAIPKLEELGDVKIDADWNALSKVGISRDDQIRVLMNSGEFHEKIKTALTCGHPGLELVCEGEGDTVSVTTESNFAKGLIVRTYDVRDLLTDRYWGIKVAPADVEEIQRHRIESLAGIIEVSIGGGSLDEYNLWLVTNTGMRAELRPWAGRLIVTQTARNHRKIERMLATLRQIQ
jgi:hypothetical protein